MAGVVVRRRAGLMALVSIVSTLFAAGYAWRFTDTGSNVALALAAGLGLVGLLHAVGWYGARMPLLIADETGLRVRLGSTWTGVVWEKVERIEVDERGSLTDGHVAVIPHDETAAMAEAGARSRFAAFLNRWLYDAPLVVPFGPTTAVSVVDMADALARLADGRTDVVRLDAEATEPEPTVELTSAQVASSATTPGSADESGFTFWSDRDWSDSDRSDAKTPAEPSPAEPSHPEDDPFQHVIAEIPAEPGADADANPDADPEVRPETDEPAAAERPFVVARDLEPSRLPVSPLRSRPARREEVTMPVRREPATMGMLALSEPAADHVTDPVEAAKLRRGDEGERSDARDTTGRDNVSLIIDATTDLTTRAMSRVRQPLRAVAPPPEDDVEPAPAPSVAATPLLIGDELAVSRRHLGLSVDELADRTRIRPYVIESLEVDNFAPCGGDFYARGHLRMLARVLGIDPAPLLTTYDEHFASSPVSPRQVFDVERATGHSGMVRGSKSGPNWGALVATVLVLLLVWGVARYFSAEDNGAAAGPTRSQNSAGLGSPGVGNAPVATPPEGHVKVMAVGGDSRVVVRDRFNQVVFEGRLVNGRFKKLTGDAPLRVMAGNGGVIALSVKGKSLGLMGGYGEKSHAKIHATPDKKQGAGSSAN